MYVQAAEKKEVFHLKIIDNSTESQISAGELEETEITDKSAMDDEREYMKLYFNDTEIPVIQFYTVETKQQCFMDQIHGHIPDWGK